MVTRPGARPHRQPNNVDLLVMITDLTKELGRPISITWIKGHQDATTDLSKLSRDAQNSIAVDALATAHRVEKYLIPCQGIAHISSTQVSLSTNGLRLPGHFDSMIRYHINGYHLRCHMQATFKWTDHDCNTIDHHAFSQFHRSLTFTMQIQRMKFIYNQQPVGTRLLKYAKVPSDSIALCPCCQDAAEDQIHLLRCGSNPVRAEAIQAFQKALHSKDLHAIFYLISFGVLKWLSGDVLSFADWDLRGYPPHMLPVITSAINSQSSIGWLSAIKGFLSSDWTTLAKMSMDDPSVTTHRAWQSRKILLMRSLSDLSEQLWKGRNEVLHRNDEREAQRHQSAEEVEIRHYHEKPELLSVSDRHYCDRPLKQILHSSPTNRRRWLRQVQQARQRRLQDELSQCKIYQFFPRSVSLDTESTVIPDYAPPPMPAPPPRQHSLF